MSHAEDNIVNGNSTLSPERFNFSADISHKIKWQLCVERKPFNFSTAES